MKKILIILLMLIPFSCGEEGTSELSKTLQDLEKSRIGVSCTYEVYQKGVKITEVTYNEGTASFGTFNKDGCRIDDASKKGIYYKLIKIKRLGK